MNMRNLIDKYSKMPIQVKAVFWFTVCSLLQKGVSVITVPVFTRIMSTEEYGVFNVFISWENIIQLFTTLSLHTGVFGTLMIQNDGCRDKIVSALLGLTTIITSFVFAVYFPFRNFFNSLLKLNTMLVCLLFLNLLFAPAFNLWAAQHRFEYKYKKLVVFSLLYSILNPLVGFFAVTNSTERASARIISQTIVSVTFYGLVYVFILIKGKTFIDVKLWKTAVLVNIPLIPHFLSSSILSQADRLMISHLIGDSEAGIYSVGYSTAMLLLLVVSSVNASITPWMYKKIKEQKSNEIGGIINISCLLIFSALVVFMILAPELMKVLAPTEYYEAIWMFPPITASVFFIYIYTIYCNIEIYYEKSIFISVSSCVAAVLNIILNFIFIPLFGFSAAGYTTLVSYLAYSIFHYLCALRISKKEGISNPVNDKLLCALSGLMIIIAFVLKQLYNYIIIRYGIIILTIFLLFIFRKRIESAIREIRRK